MSRGSCSHPAAGCTLTAAPYCSHLAKSFPTTKCFGVTLAGRDNEGSQPSPHKVQLCQTEQTPGSSCCGKCCEPLMEQPPPGHGTPLPKSARLAAGHKELSFVQEGTLASLSTVPRGNVWAVVPIMRGH